MDLDGLALWLGAIGTLCWIPCFWWMYHLSSKQNALIEELKEQTRRIETLSKIEHDLIKEVHPKVSEIKDGVEEVAAVVKGEQPNNRRRAGS